jgi:hypothetical protein
MGRIVRSSTSATSLVLECPRPGEDEFASVLMPGAVEEEGVDVRVEAQVGGGALQDGD